MPRHTLALPLLISCAFLGLVACAQEATEAPERAAPPAETAAAETEAPASPANLSLADKVSSGSYAIDPNHGYVTFSYSHLGFSRPQLRFRTVDATLNFDAETPANSAVNVTIDAASIDSGVDVFDSHLNSDGWMNTAAFPTITFTSTNLTQDDAGSGTMAGDLMVMGITKPVTLDVTLLGAGKHPMASLEVVGIEARGSLLRSDFGLGKYAPNISDEVEFLISAEFHKPAE